MGFVTNSNKQFEKQTVYGEEKSVTEYESVTGIEKNK